MSHVVCIGYSLLSIIQDGVTALMYASYEGHTEVVKVLAEAKADLNITDKVNLIINYLLTLTIDVYYDYCFIFHYRMVTLLSSMLPRRVILV